MYPQKLNNYNKNLWFSQAEKLRKVRKAVSVVNNTRGTDPLCSDLLARDKMEKSSKSSIIDGQA